VSAESKTIRLSALFVEFLSGSLELPDTRLGRWQGLAHQSLIGRLARDPRTTMLVTFTEMVPDRMLRPLAGQLCFLDHLHKTAPVLIFE
jgi:hypothetical protein